MRLVLPPDLRADLEAALRKAGSNEIGGILMAEHVGENDFKVRSLTIQTHGGSFAAFIRNVGAFLKPLKEFFRRTNHDYVRFNYIGEWHSHPSFAPVPSGTDHRTMREIIEDPEVGANFVVLMVVKLDLDGSVIGTVTFYAPGGSCSRGELFLDNE